MKIKILGTTKDLRTNTNVVYAIISIDDYLDLVGENFADFSIQRRKEKHKAYLRMKNDLKEGALLPPITLAIKPEMADLCIKLLEAGDIKELEKELSKKNIANILDGLQRTYILKDIQDEGYTFREGQKLLLEFWFERNISNLIYRIIVLNAGQKPMSMRHQLEILFFNVKDDIEKRIPNLEITQEKFSTIRNKSRKYSFDRIIQAYQGFLYGSAEIQKENIIAQRLMDESILEADENELSQKFEEFVGFLGTYAELDDEICRIYKGDDEKEIPTGRVWFGSENVMRSFFAAVSDYGNNEQRKVRVINSLQILKDNLHSSKVGEDPLGLEQYIQIQKGINARKTNVGSATRRLISRAFKEYFREEGIQSLEKCWLEAAE